LSRKYLTPKHVVQLSTRVTVELVAMNAPVRVTLREELSEEGVFPPDE
jgi:hypothetical protein